MFISVTLSKPRTGHRTVREDIYLFDLTCRHGESQLVRVPLRRRGVRGPTVCTTDGVRD